MTKHCKICGKDYTDKEFYCSDCKSKLIFRGSELKKVKPKFGYSYHLVKLPKVPPKHIAISAIVIAALVVFYFYATNPTSEFVYKFVQVVNNPVFASPDAPALRFSSVDFLFYDSPADLGLERIPPDMVYCYNALDNLKNSGSGIGFAVVAVKNVGNKPVALSTSTLHKTNEAEVDIYGEAETDRYGKLLARKPSFERTCSEDGIIHFITSRQAGNTDPIMLQPGQEFRFLGMLSATSSRSYFCGKSYPINMAATVRNEAGDINTFDLDSRVLTVRC